MRFSRLGTVLAVGASLSACTFGQRVGGAGAAIAVTGVAFTYASDTQDKDDDQAKIGIGLAITGLIVMFVGAAIHERTDEPKPKEIRVARPATEDADARSEAERIRARNERRERAWAITRQAQDAARAGDCTAVVDFSAQVGALDTDFYSTVFLRDAGIQRCFSAPATTTPAPDPAAAPAAPATPAPQD